MSTDTKQVGIREIDPGALPTRYARGWHCLGVAKDFLDGKPHSVAGVRHQTGGVRRLTRRPQGPRRLLPAHGRRPVRGHHQGRRGGLPVPRLALGRRRQVQAGAVRQAHAADWPAPGRGRPTSAAACCSSGMTTRAIRRSPRSGSPRFPRPPATSGPTGGGTASSSRAPTAARSSTTSPTWRTSSTSTSGCRRTSRTSSRATSPRSTCTTWAGPT